MFTQPFNQAQIKETIKVPHHWPLCGEFTGDRWNPRTNWWRYHEFVKSRFVLVSKQIKKSHEISDTCKTLFLSVFNLCGGIILFEPRASCWIEARYIEKYILTEMLKILRKIVLSIISNKMRFWLSLKGMLHGMNGKINSCWYQTCMLLLKQHAWSHVLTHGSHVRL